MLCDVKSVLSVQEKILLLYIIDIYIDVCAFLFY